MLWILCWVAQNLEASLLRGHWAGLWTPQQMHSHQKVVKNCCVLISFLGECILLPLSWVAFWWHRVGLWAQQQMYSEKMCEKLLCFKHFWAGRHVVTSSLGGPKFGSVSAASTLGGPLDAPTNTRSVKNL